jgi:hypothetical protein
MSVSVSYYVRGGGGVTILGSSTPPTAQQAAQVQMQKAVINFADADVQALFTHNMGLDASAPGYFDPEAWIEGYGSPAQPAATYMPNFTFDFSNTNVLKINKLNFLGTGGTYLATVRRPWSGSQ